MVQAGQALTFDAIDPNEVLVRVSCRFGRARAPWTEAGSSHSQSVRHVGSQADGQLTGVSAELHQARRGQRQLGRHDHLSTCACSGRETRTCSVSTSGEALGEGLRGPVEPCLSVWSPSVNKLWV